jgi:pyruvate dehydrogenase E2 component (dihydrolipoamide acetyltransferase)
MARSAREIPHYHLATTVDLSAALRWLTDANERRSVGERLLPGALLLKATALAARQVPALNGFWIDDGFRPSAAVHLGVAVSLRGGGLVAPALHDADRLSLDELMAGLRDLVGRARAGRLRSSEMADPTLTVTNLGDQGVDEVHGVIYAPQVALVGFGKVAERPWASGGMLGARPTVRATLAADHRASDGMVGARFLNALAHLLETPEDL